MTSINILHASDLHIAQHKQLRSLLDQLGDLDDPWDTSSRGLLEKLKLTKGLLMSFWKETSASSHDPEALEAFAEFVYASAKQRLTNDGQLEQNPDGQLDAVILTGDLATTGAEGDLEKALNFLKAPMNPKYPHRAKLTDYRGATLSAVKIPIIYLPGNHDRYVPTTARHQRIFPKFFEPGGTHFDRILSDYRKEPIRRDELTSKITSDKELKIIIFTADFTLEDFQDHEGLFGWLAQGKVYSDIRKKLVAATRGEVARKKETETMCIIWAIHFPPAYPGVKTHSRLLGDEQLINLANEAGVSAILAGHTHKQLKYSSPASGFEVFCCGTTTQFEPLTKSGGRHVTNLLEGNLFQLLTISADHTGKLDIDVSHYRYTGTSHGTGPSEMFWRKVP